MRRSERFLDIAVVSDLHLGTAACRARELLGYLEGIAPRLLVLNGDIFDCWHFAPSRWDRDHQAVVARVLELAARGCEVHYLVGNHDAALVPWLGHRFAGVHLGERLEREVAGERLLFCHGDAFDRGRRERTRSKALGDALYDSISAVDRAVERARARFGGRHRSFVGWCKDRLGPVTAYIDRYERDCLAGAAADGFDGVVCGHIHRARLRAEVIGERVVSYRNSGDWVDSRTALEHRDGTWRIVGCADGAVAALDEHVPREAAFA